MAGRFEGKVALVTGGSSGIGESTALKFAAEGAKVAISARGAERGNETVAKIKAAGNDAIFIKTDVSVAIEVEAMVKTTVATFGRLDYAFNNAGCGNLVRGLDAPEEAWDKVIDTNLKGVWLCMKYEIPQMLKVGGGAIVNNSSISGVGGSPRRYQYVASKHGVNGLTKCAAIEWAKEGIRVNAVVPGIIETPMWGEITPEYRTELDRSQPIARMGRADEVADTVLWFCSDQSSYVTGVTLLVDGGMCAQP